jgi:hypothetical protein
MDVAMDSIILCSNHFANLPTKKANCIPQHDVRVFSIMDMIDLNTAIVCNVSVGCQIALILLDIPSSLFDLHS